jgi:hypothetical protein
LECNIYSSFVPQRAAENLSWACIKRKIKVKAKATMKERRRQWREREGEREKDRNYFVGC